MRYNDGFCYGMQTSLILSLALLGVSESHAQKSWNSATDGFWNLGGNWTPPGVPGSADDVTIGNIAGTEGTRVTLDVNAFANTITLQNGNDLDTADFELTADSISLGGSGTTLLVKPNNGASLNSVDVDFMDINTGGTLLMLGGRVEIEGNTGDGRLDVLGRMTGYGFVDLEALAAGSRFTLNGGTLNVGNTFDGMVVLADVARTLEVNAVDPLATVDFDNGASPVVNLLASGTLDLNVPMNDAFDAVINLSRKSTLDVADAWVLSGTMNINTQAGSFIGQTAGPATLRGGSITMQDIGTVLNLDNAADHLIVDLDGQFTTTGGTINFELGKLQFDSPGNIGAGTDFVNGDATELILNATLTVDDDDWDWDGSGGADQIITINDLGQLNANITSALADDAWSGTMNINGGNLNVQASNNDWSSTATINIGGSTLSRILGDEFHQDAGTTTVVAGADLDVSSANVWNAGAFVVNGDAELNGATTWDGTAVSGTGTLQQDSDATVTSNTTINVRVYDLDGNTGSNSDITINSGVAFTINSEAIDTSGGYNGNLHVNSAILDVNTANWALDSSGDLNLSNTGGGGATLEAGGTLTVNSGANVTALGLGNLINTDVIFEEGSNLNINNAGQVSSGNGATITLAGGDVIQNVGGGIFINDGILVVTGTSTISVTTFDWDQGSTTIESSGNLSINVTNIDSAAPVNQYDNTLTINGGSLSVDNAANVWLMDSTTNFNGGGTISGDAVRFGNDSGTRDSNLNVTGAGVAVISSTAAFLSDADVFIGAGATLRNTNTATFEPENAGVNGEFTGTGIWQLGGANTFNDVTTINMTGGTLDLDNSFNLLPLFANDTAINADVTINVATMASYGNRGEFLGNPNFSDMHIADTATLTVNLDNATDEWTVNNNGRINYNGNASVNTFLAGSDLNMNGIMNVDGDGRSNTRLDIGGTVNIVNAAEPLHLNGGTLADPNTLVGGTINGPGALMIDSARELSGFGRINADVDGNGSAELTATDGVLDVNGAILDIGTLRSNGTTAVLDLANPFDSNLSSNGIILDGGRIQGNTITLSTQNLRGNGIVTNRIVNDNDIVAQSGTLIVDNNTNDWDGTGNAGRLFAQSGTLELRDAGTFTFAGVVRALENNTVFANGFRLEFEPTSTLELNDGVFRSTNGTNIGGAINAQGGTSTIQIPGAVVIELTSSTMLTGDLRLDNTNTVIEAGAAFSGGGTLTNTAGSQLTLQDGAAVNVLLENEGVLVLGSSAGQTTGLDFEQTASGTWELELGGLGLSDFDRMNLTGAAAVDGTLELFLIAGYNPTVGDTLNFMSAVGGVSGSFSSLLQPEAMPAGLEFAVNNLGTILQLEVVNSVLYSADFDRDGDVDGDDLTTWQAAYGAGNGADADGDGDSDGDDFLAWQQQFGSGVSVFSTLQAVPEPSSVGLLALALMFLPRRQLFCFTSQLVSID